jgi:hypothetical protein
MESEAKFTEFLDGLVVEFARELKRRAIASSPP